MLSQSKLILLLKFLSKEEFKQFEKWLKSPWCNSNKSLIRFYEIINPYFPHFESNRLTKEKIYAKIYPKKQYNVAMMRNLMSEFSKQVEKFLCFEQLKQEEVLQQFHLTNAMLERNSFQLFQKKASELIASLEDKSNKDLLDLFLLVQLNENLYQTPASHESLNSIYLALNKYDLYLDHFYLLGKCRFLIEMLEGKLQFEDKLPPKLQFDFVHQLNQIHAFPAINIYEIYFDERNRHSDNFFSSLEAALLRELDHLNFKDQKILLQLLINENARLLRKADHQRSYFEKALELYKIGIKKKLLFHNNRMPVNTFVNIVTTGNVLKEEEFTIQFIEVYSKQLDGSNPEDVRDWARAHLAFYTKNPEFWELAKTIIQNKIADTHFALRARVLVLQMWLEDFIQGKEQDLDFVLNMCRALDRQTNKNKYLTTEQQQAYKKFVAYAKKLALSVEKGAAGLEKIDQQVDKISTAQNLHGKTWLLSKIKEIKR